MTEKEIKLRDLFYEAINQADETDYVQDSEGNETLYSYTDKSNAAEFCVQKLKELIDIETLNIL